MNKEQVYYIMNGDIDGVEERLPEGVEIKDAFEPGSECCLLYDQVYDAKLRLCSRLNVEEDADVELIIGNMSRITKILACQMYEYGKLEELKEK